MNSIVMIITIQITCLVTIAISHTDAIQIPPNGLGAKGIHINVTTLLEWPNTDSFMSDYAKPGRPFIVQNAANDWPASQKWTDEYFLGINEGMKDHVTVEQAKKEDRGNPATQISFHEFVKHYQMKDWYMVEKVPMFLREDIIMPAPFQCPVIADLLLEEVMWFSNGGTKSVLHFDSMDNIHCLITGRKLFVLIDSNNKVDIDQPHGGYSSVDVDNVDYSKYPDLLTVEYHMAYLSAGDCLYLPYHWYHQVRAVDRNIGINVWWDHFSMMSLDYSRCEDEDMQHHKTMDQFQFHGTAALLKHQEVVKSRFLMLASQGGAPLTYQRLLFMYLGDEEMRDKDETLNELFHKVFNTLDLNEDGKVVPDEVETLPKEQWVLIQDSMQRIQHYFEEYAPEADLFGDDENIAEVDPVDWNDPQYDTYDDMVFHEEDMDYVDGYPHERDEL